MSVDRFDDSHLHSRYVFSEKLFPGLGATIQHHNTSQGWPLPRHKSMTWKWSLSRTKTLNALPIGVQYVEEHSHTSRSTSHFPTAPESPRPDHRTRTRLQQHTRLVTPQRRLSLPIQGVQCIEPRTIGIAQLRLPDWICLWTAVVQSAQ